MAVEFSELTKLFLERQPVIVEAWHRLLLELREMLSAVAERLHPVGWDSRFIHQPPRTFQFYRPDWPQQQNGAHYEVSAHSNLENLGSLEVALHVEGGVPGQRDVLGRLRDLLQAHQEQIREQCLCSVVQGAGESALKTELRTRDVNCEVLYDRLKRVMLTAPFVDEALFLGRNDTIWRTDFGDPRTLPRLDIDGSAGGQEIRQEGGVLGTPCLVIADPDEGNHHVVDGRPTHLMLLRRTKDIQPDDRIYLSSLVHTEKGGRLWFFADGTPLIESTGKEVVPVLSHSRSPAVEVRAKAAWQHVTFIEESRVRAETGADARIYLRSQTDDCEFKINSVEIGRYVSA